MHEEKFGLKFKPAFHESSEITFTLDKPGGRVDFVLMKRNSGDDPIDTILVASQRISKSMYDKLLRDIFFNAELLRSSDWTGCCDGMSIWYSHVRKGDTSALFLRSPRRTTDSAGYEVTVRALNQMRTFVTDTILLKHFDDVQSYIE